MNNLLVIKYGFFAIIAIAVNIGAQNIVLMVYNKEYSLYLAMVVGVFFGLVAKYILDKKYIFYYKVQNYADNMQKFILYSFFGGITTCIFFGFELLFNSLFGFGGAKFIGAAVGLSIGYFIKYHLDKKFVFIKI